MKRSIIVQVISTGLIFLFVYAATSKWLTFTAFLGQLAHDPLIGHFAGILVWLVPIAEYAIVVLLAVPRFRHVGLLASAAILMLFTAYIAVLLFGFGGNLPCHCGGVISIFTWPQHLLFNLFFLFLAVIGIAADGRAKHQNKNLKPAIS